jgi:type IV/VI secretion system ImpK/VasF family protein
MTTPLLIMDALPTLKYFNDFIGSEVLDDDEVLNKKYQELITSIDAFKQSALLHYGDEKIIAHASYLLCAFIDEEITALIGLKWKPYSLLVAIHKSAHGGENCWKNLEYYLAIPDYEVNQAQFDLMRFYELLITQGYQGRYALKQSSEFQDLKTKLCDRLHSSEAKDTYIQRLAELAYQNQYIPRMRQILIVSAILITGFILIFISTSKFINESWRQIAVDTDRIINQFNSDLKK